jgi:hypothetical protein
MRVLKSIKVRGCLIVRRADKILIGFNFGLFYLESGMNLLNSSCCASAAE